MHQFFAETRAEEEEALSGIWTSSGLDLVVTYNGRHFDLPFLETALEKVFRSARRAHPITWTYIWCSTVIHP